MQDSGDGGWMARSGERLNRSRPSAVLTTNNECDNNKNEIRIPFIVIFYQQTISIEAKYSSMKTMNGFIQI